MQVFYNGWHVISRPLNHRIRFCFISAMAFRRGHYSGGAVHDYPADGSQPDHPADHRGHNARAGYEHLHYVLPRGYAGGGAAHGLGLRRVGAALRIGHWGADRNMRPYAGRGVGAPRLGRQPDPLGHAPSPAWGLRAALDGRAVADLRRSCAAAGPRTAPRARDRRRCPSAGSGCDDDGAQQWTTAPGSERAAFGRGPGGPAPDRWRGPRYPYPDILEVARGATPWPPLRSVATQPALFRRHPL